MSRSRIKPPPLTSGGVPVVFPLFVGIDAIAALTGMSRFAIDRLIRKGAFPHHCRKDARKRLWFLPKSARFIAGLALRESLGRANPILSAPGNQDAMACVRFSHSDKNLDSIECAANILLDRLGPGGGNAPIIGEALFGLRDLLLAAWTIEDRAQGVEPGDWRLAQETSGENLTKWLERIRADYKETHPGSGGKPLFSNTIIEGV
jgi:hypothetical protein